MNTAPPPGGQEQHGRGGTHTNLRDYVFLFLAHKPKYPVGVVLTLPEKGLALDRLGVGV